MAGMTRPTPIPLRPDRYALEHEQRRSLTRAITAIALAGTTRSPSTVLKSAWPYDDAAGLILRAAVSPTLTSTYPAFQAATVLPNLAPASAAIRLFNASLTLDMAGINTVRVPHAVTVPAPIFVPEGSAAPTVQLSLAATDVGPVRKILILAAVTSELENATPETASAVVGRILSNAVTKSLDAIAFGTAAADSAKPAGLLNGVSALPASTASGVIAAAEDIGAMAGAMAAAGVDPEGMILVAAPQQAVALKLMAAQKFDNEIFGTPVLADGTVVGFARGAVAAAFDGAPSVEASKEALVHFEDTTPLAISTPGSPNTVAAPTRSAFQQDMLIIRVRAKATWAVIAPGGVQVITNTKW
jgi:hypothetical protein